MSWSVDKIPLYNLSIGQNLSLTTYTFESKNAGPHIYLQSSVHGAELQGNIVLLKLMDLINSTKINGKITIVPLANPYATLQKSGTYTTGRFNPFSGDNWNRNYIDIIKESQFDLKSFVEQNKDLAWHELKLIYKEKLDYIYHSYYQSLEQKNQLHANNKLNLILQKLALSADAVLDLHTGPVATRYLYCPNYAKQAGQYLNFEHVLMVPEEFAGAMDEACFMPWVHLKNELKNQGREILLDIESFTLELGSEEVINSDDANSDLDKIINFLKYKGSIEGKPILQNNSTYCPLDNFETIYSPNAGLIEYLKRPGDHFKANEEIARIFNFSQIDPFNPIQSSYIKISVDYDGVLINHLPTCNVHEGMELMQVFRNVKL